MSDKISLRLATKLAEGHALGILESTNDEAFWGEEFWGKHDEQWQILQRARDIVGKRIMRNRK